MVDVHANNRQKLEYTCYYPFKLNCKGSILPRIWKDKSVIFDLFCQFTIAQQLQIKDLRRLNRDHNNDRSGKNIF
jgi:hypothetical protein